jgi:hypothetical protein
MIESNADAILDCAHLEGPRRILSTYDFRLGSLPQRITIRLYWNISKRKVEFEQSHFLYSPAQFGPYITNSAYGNTEEDALREALKPLTTFYDYAIREGHTPEETWLVPNKSFRKMATARLFRTRRRGQDRGPRFRLCSMGLKDTTSQQPGPAGNHS